MVPFDEGVEREIQLQQLELKLQKRCTAPILLQRISALLRQWTQKYPIQIQEDDTALHSINQAFHDQ